MKINGRNIIGGVYTDETPIILKSYNPSTNTELDGAIYKADETMVNMALKVADDAFDHYQSIGKDQKANFLKTIAIELVNIKDQIVTRASLETGLTTDRLQGELLRTTNQLVLFADLVKEGSWVSAIVDNGDVNRKPLAKPDVRRMLVPLGPVVVFGASNFPLAFSVAGGDTASALAAGCPVIVKAHSAHYGTSALVGSAIIKAIEKTKMPKGIFSLLFGSGNEVGKALVQHPYTKAVAFTGSESGGMALVNLSQQRKEPIPVFAEMGSINPIIFLPKALNKRGKELGHIFANSITQSVGQLCTNPGLMLMIETFGLEDFKQSLTDTIINIPPATMLSEGISISYNKLSSQALKEDGVELLAQSHVKAVTGQNQGSAKITTVKAKEFITNSQLQNEVFGPYSLLVICKDIKELEEVVEVLDGQLTMTVIAENDEITEQNKLINKLQRKCGRIIFNGVPTGVEVCAAMQHGGPFPATSDSRFTSVGATAIYRFVRPFVWQNWKKELLPAELQDSNPLKIYRLIDNKLKK